MTAKEVVQLYFKKLNERSDWQSLIADDIKFDSPSSTTFGKDAYIVAASRFFQMVESFEVKHLVTEGAAAGAWVDYTLCLKNGKRSNCFVSELLLTRNDKIISSAILFDTLALKIFTSED